MKPEEMDAIEKKHGYRPTPIRVAIDVLAVNYRIGPAEASLLGILSAGISREILDALVDRPTLEKWLEKKTAETAGANTGGG